MNRFITWHISSIERIKRKLGLSDYAVLWVSFIKGLVFGFLIAYLYMK